VADDVGNASTIKRVFLEHICDQILEHFTEDNLRMFFLDFIPK